MTLIKLGWPLRLMAMTFLSRYLDISWVGKNLCSGLFERIFYDSWYCKSWLGISTQRSWNLENKGDAEKWHWHARTSEKIGRSKREKVRYWEHWCWGGEGGCLLILKMESERFPWKVIRLFVNFLSTRICRSSSCSGELGLKSKGSQMVSVCDESSGWLQWSVNTKLGWNLTSRCMWMRATMLIAEVGGKIVMTL